MRLVGWWSVTLALTLGGTLGCESIGPEPAPSAVLHVIPVNAREYDPWRERFVPWATEVASCLGIPADGAAVVEEIRWIAVDAIETYPSVGSVAGWYIPPSDGGPLVYLVAGAMYTEFAVKHEMMHHFVDDPEHRDTRWGQCTEA